MALTTITGNMVSVNAIQGTLIADNAITAVHIASNAVTSIQIAENNVTAREIASNSITVAQLADASVESDKIANGVITTNHLNSAMISSQTEVTAVAGDFVLLGDTSDSNNLKKAPVSSIVALAGVADGAVTSAKLDTNIAVAGTLGVTGDITGTLATAAQPNITSLGSLTALDVTGSVTANSLITDDDVAGLTTLGRYSSGFAFSLLRPSSSALGIEIRTNAGNSLAHFLNDGTTKLHHNGSVKLTTTATGIEVTGTVTAADSLNVNNAGKIGFNTESEYTLNSIPSPDLGCG